MGVSELYASMLMIGVTLAVGGLVTSAAIAQAGLAGNAGSSGGSLAVSAAGVHVAFVYSTVASPGGCPTYEGTSEGTTLVVSVFDYGSTPFTPTEILVNSSLFAGGYSTLQPSTLGSYSLAVAGCAHQSGQTVTLGDALGDEIQFET